MQDNMGLFHLYNRLWIGCHRLGQSMDKLGTPSPHMSVSRPELLVQITPANPCSAVKMVQSECQPHVDVESCGAVLQLLDCCVLQRHRMTAQLVEKIAVEQDAILE